MEDREGEGVGGWNEKERKSKNILMFEKIVEMNKIRYGGIRGGKLVIVRAKGDRLESCHALQKEGGGGGASENCKLILSTSEATTPTLNPPFLFYKQFGSPKKKQKTISDLQG